MCRPSGTELFSLKNRIKGSATCVVCSTLLAVYLLLPDKKYKHIPYLKFFVNKPKNLEYVRAKLETGELPEVYRDFVSGVTIIIKGLIYSNFKAYYFFHHPVKYVASVFSRLTNIDMHLDIK